MHSFKKIISVVGIIAMLLVILLMMDYILYPCTFMRNDIHAVSSNTYNDVYVGTSHGKMNIDPETIKTITGRSGHNLCVGGEYPVDVLYMVKLMVETGHKPDRIVYEISPGYFVREKEVGNNYLLFFHEFPMTVAKLSYFWDAVLKCDFRTLFFPWYEYELSYELSHAKETIKKKSAKDYSADGFATDSQMYHESGFIERYPVDITDSEGNLLKDDLADEALAGKSLVEEGLIEEGEIEEWFPEDIVDENMENLKKIIDFCKENDIEFVAITTPLSDVVLNECEEGNSALNDYYSDFFKEENVDYINFNYDKYYDMSEHGIENFTDLDGHMNGDAARSFSAILAEVLE